MKVALAVIGMVMIAAALVLGAAAGYGYEPPNPAAYAPRALPTDEQLVHAAVKGCVEGLGLVQVGVSDGVALVRCRPTLGVVKVSR